MSPISQSEAGVQTATPASHGAETTPRSQTVKAIVMGMPQHSHTISNRNW